MKRRLMYIFYVFALIMFCVTVAAEERPERLERLESKEVSIMFTHDIHSHFDTEVIEIDGEISYRGGFAKLKTATDEIREIYPNTYLFDGGDFAMGTPFQTIFSTDAAEIRMLGRLGFDAATLGNHEFDYRATGLTDMLNAAMAYTESDEHLPQLLIANIDWEKTFADSSREKDAKELRESLQKYGVSEEYTYFTRDDITIAVFGIFGRESDAFAPESGLYFLDPIERGKEVVAKIKADGKADMIVCLSHSGTKKEIEKSEDEQLAKAVPEIDLIVSAHTHTLLEEPIIHGDTAIVSCGAYTDNLGHVTFTQNGERWKVKEYDIIPLDSEIADNAEVLKDIEVFREKVSERYFSQFGYEYDEILAVAPFAFTDINEFSKVQGEDSLGNLISDAFIYAVKEAEGDDYENVDVAVVPSGVVRGSFGQGEITVSNAYNVSSLGIGPDKIPGYPVVSIYLTGAELKTIAEIDISVSPLMGEARLYISGLAYEYNPNRLILNRVTDVWFDTKDGRKEIDDNKLYRVVGGLYSCQMLGAVEAQSFGILSVTPKDKQGAPIENFENHLVYENGKELKEWEALAKYLESFEKTDGVSVVPEYYNELHDRKILNDDSSIGAIIKNPNKIAIIFVCIVILIVAVLAAIIIFIVKIAKRIKRKHRS